MDKRPELTINISVKDFKEFYWYKKELIEFCRVEKLNRQGGKIELTNRIEKYLSTGKREKQISNSQKVISKINWNTEQLTLKTLITDSYSNTQNVREFFIEQIGNKFKFNVKFMNWMKSSKGKTLEEAIEKWFDIISKSKKDKSLKIIAPQFEYNTYIRDFLKENPTLPRKTAIECWKIKKTRRGDNKYQKTDLEMINK